MVPHASILITQAAQLALEAADRRRKLAAKLSGFCVDDKRPRPTPTPSTHVTPEGKKVCGSTESLESDIQPRSLSFADADASGNFVYQTNRVHGSIMGVEIKSYQIYQRHTITSIYNHIYYYYIYIHLISQKQRYL